MEIKEAWERMLAKDRASERAAKKQGSDEARHAELQRMYRANENGNAPCLSMSFDTFVANLGPDAWTANGTLVQRLTSRDPDYEARNAAAQRAQREARESGKDRQLRQRYNELRRNSDPNLSDAHVLEMAAAQMRGVA